MRILGVVLIVLGILALIYQGVTYTTHKKVLDIGPIQATKEEHNTIPIPPIVGALAPRFLRYVANSLLVCAATLVLSVGLALLTTTCSAGSLTSLAALLLVSPP